MTRYVVPTSYWGGCKKHLRLEFAPAFESTLLRASFKVGLGPRPWRGHQFGVHRPKAPHSLLALPLSPFLWAPLAPAPPGGGGGGIRNDTRDDEERTGIICYEYTEY